jgi:hypothetical protein
VRQLYCIFLGLDLSVELYAAEPRRPRFSSTYGSGASGRSDFKIRDLKPLPPPSLELQCVSWGTNLETNGSNRRTCVSLGVPYKPAAQLQRVLYEVRRGQTGPIQAHELRRHALGSQAHKTASILNL